MSDEFDQKMQLGADLPEPEPGSSAERMFAEGDASLDRIQKSLMEAGALIELDGGDSTETRRALWRAIGTIAEHVKVLDSVYRHQFLISQQLISFFNEQHEQTAEALRALEEQSQEDDEEDEEWKQSLHE